MLDTARYLRVGTGLISMPTTDQDEDEGMTVLAKIPRPRTSLGTALLFIFVALLILVILLVLVVPLVSTASVANMTSATSALLDRARLAAWYLPAKADPPIFSHGYQGTDLVGGYQESDALYSNGNYYL